MNTKEFDKMHIEELVNCFQKVRVENYTHDTSKEYALFTRLLKSKPIQKKYDLDKFKAIISYFEKNGLMLKDGNIFAFFQHAFQYPEVALQRYNTIDLKTDKEKTSLKEEKNETNKTIQPKSRKYYEKAMKDVKSSLQEQMEKSRKDGTPIDTKYDDPEIPKEDSSNGIGCKNCINGYIPTQDGSWTPCECYIRERNNTRILNAGIPKAYLHIEKIQENLIDTCGKKKFGQSIDRLVGVDINTFIQNYKNNINRVKEEGWFLLLEGATGTAKTTTACICGKNAIRSGYSVLFAEVQNLRKIWTGEKLSPELEHLKKELYSVDFLILDDLGQEFISNTSEYQLSEMDYLIRERISENRCTIFTTNSTQDEIKKRYQERIYSLLKQKTIHIILTTKIDIRESNEMPDFL